MRVVLSIAALAVMSLAAASSPPRAPRTPRTPRAPRAPRYDHIFTLKPKEGVFAYARIAPDGKRLAYASQFGARTSTQRNWTVTAVDLSTQKVLFSEGGIDAYWSNDGTRIVYSGNGGVTVRNVANNTVATYQELGGLGDYYSWAVRDGRDLIMTIQNNYYYLTKDGPVLPHAKVTTCDGIGTGERPLISHDGKRISTFVKGILVVRYLDNCDDILDTHVQGSKADFSWDGRYIAFHAVKREGTGYEIRIVDLEKRTVRTLPNLQGSALFPSWTRDGRLCFRYDGPDYRGFVMASNVLDAVAEPLPAMTEALPEHRTWEEIFPETPTTRGLRVVMIWAPWSAHSLEAFTNLQEARAAIASNGLQVEMLAAADPGSRETDITDQLDDYHVTIRRIPLSQKHLAMTEARNQMPTTLLFRDGVLVDRRLGAQSVAQLRDWVGGAARMK